MGSDPPPTQAVFSNIISNTSPSMGSNDSSRSQLRPDSPEPLSEEDIVRMRSRITDMGLELDSRPTNNTNLGNPASREDELGSMVVKLLDSFVDPTQLYRQAEFIDWLRIQRDLLVQSFEEERRRWVAEREGWNRIAEALLSQRARAANSSQRDEELERQCAAYESENKSLREKIQDSHSRFSALESELNKLKPLLLMQPPSHSAALSSERFFVSRVKQSAELGGSKERRKVVDSPIVEEPELKDSATTPREHTGTPQTHPNTHLEPSRSQPRADHNRRHSRSSFLSPRIPSHSTPARSIFSATQTPATHHSSKKSKSKHKRFLSSNLPSLTADARTELLLLAARKIGRERASAVSGLMRRIEKEKEDMAHEQGAERMDRERLDRVAAGGVGSNSYYRKDLLDPVTSPGASTVSAMPKTPKRGTNAGQPTTHFLTPTLMTPHSDFQPPSNKTLNSFVFVGTPATTAYQISMASTLTPRLVDQTTHAAVKPASAQTSPATSSSTSHPTPLASLLSAAKSMMDDESSSTSNGRRRAGVLEPPESPVPKRRKVGNGTFSNGRGTLGATSTPGSDRVRSALDVLADQAAAAFDSDWQSPVKSPTKPSSKNKGKGPSMPEGSAAPSEKEEVESDSTPKGRTRATRDSHSRTSTTGSPLPTRSRSKALLTDRLPKAPSKTPRHRKLDKFAVDLQKRSAPVPRVIFSPGARSSIPLRQSLSPLPGPSPTPPPTVREDRDTAVLTRRPVGARSVDDGDTSLPNGIASQSSKSPLLSSKGDDVGQERSRTQSPSPDLANTISTAGQQDDTVTLSTLPQTPNQATDKASAGDHPSMTSVAETECDPHGEKNSSSDHIPDGRAVEEKEETGDKNQGVGVHAQSQTQSSHAGRSFISDESEHDTDADAEGEMDVDAEEETVILDSSSMLVTNHHDTPSTLSLGLPQSQLGITRTITSTNPVVSSTFAVNNERNSGLA